MRGVLRPVPFMAYEDPGHYAAKQTPYALTLQDSERVAGQALSGNLQVFKVPRPRMTGPEMVVLARKLHFSGVLRREFGASSSEWDRWLVKNDDHMLTIWPDLFRWEWVHRGYAGDLEWQLKHEGTRDRSLDAPPATRTLSRSEIDSLARATLDNALLLPPDAVMASIAARKGDIVFEGEKERRITTHYVVLYRRRLAGFEIAGRPNSCTVTVSATGRAVRVEAMWPELQSAGTFPLRPIGEAFEDLRHGRGEPVAPPFSAGVASFSGLFYCPGWDRTFHPCYRFTVRCREGHEQYFFVPAIGPEYYRDGVAVVWTSESEGLGENELTSRVLEMMEKIEQDCQPFLDRRYVGMKRDPNDVLWNTWFKINELAEEIPPNLVPGVSRQWADNTLELAERLLAAVGTDERPPEGPTALQAILVRTAESLLRLLHKHGRPEGKAAIEKLRVEYSRRIQWAAEFLFGIE